jgi:hypothetical protein
MKILVVVLSCILMMSNVAAQDMFAKKSIFSQYEPIVEKKQVANIKETIGEYPQLQIGEEMRVVYAKVSTATGAPIPLGRVTLFSERGKKLLYTVDTTVNLQQGASSDWTDTPCKREDFLWKRSIGGKFQDMNCVSINHFVNYFVNPTGDFQQIAVWAKDEGIEIPPTIIRATFTRYSSGGKRLVYVVDVNPEQYGIERDATIPWGSNGWHKEFIKRDPKKIEFIEKLKVWATDVQERMDDAFKKNTKAFAGMKNLDEYLSDSGKKEIQKKSMQEQSTEEKLVRLKSLYEKGLLTESQYNDQVKDVLSGK